MANIKYKKIVSLRLGQILWFCLILSGGTMLYGAPDYSYSTFNKALEAGNEEEISKIGQSLLSRLTQAREGEKGLKVYKSKITAAEYLANQMISQLKRATRERMIFTGKELLMEKKSRKVMVIPAKEYYQAASKVFSLPIPTDAFSKEEKIFLVRYYNFLLRKLTANIGKAGMALAMADPEFKGTYDYILVLPLLHTARQKPINVEVLPKWLYQPEQLGILSDSCLLHYGLPCQAMHLSKRVSEMMKKGFSEKEYYEQAALKCEKVDDRIAVECLTLAIGCVPAKDRKAILALEYRIFQQWWDGGNYLMATTQAKRIMQQYSDLDESVKAVEQYYTGLANSGNADGILVDIDNAINSPRYKQYKPQLLFVKWWALRRKRDQTARLAATEEVLLKQYGESAIVAPVLFSRAMDYLSNQEYDSAQQILNKIVTKFPASKSAEQATRIMERLKSVMNN